MDTRVPRRTPRVDTRLPRRAAWEKQYTMGMTTIGLSAPGYKGHKYPTVLEPDLYPTRTMLKKHVERETISEVDQTTSELTDTFNVFLASTPQRNRIVGLPGMSPSSPPECDYMLGQQ